MTGFVNLKHHSSISYWKIKNLFTNDWTWSSCQYIFISFIERTYELSFHIGQKLIIFLIFFKIRCHIFAIIGKLFHKLVDLSESFHYIFDDSKLRRLFLVSICLYSFYLIFVVFLEIFYWFLKSYVLNLNSWGRKLRLAKEVIPFLKSLK